jgi:hypothetical protein
VNTGVKASRAPALLRGCDTDPVPGLNCAESALDGGFATMKFSDRIHR